MKRSLLKWHKREQQLKNGHILWIVTEGTIQIEAETYIGRKLTDVELNRMIEEFEDGDTRFRFTKFVCETIDEVLNNTDGRWDGLDERFLKEKEGKKNS